MFRSIPMVALAVLAPVLSSLEAQEQLTVPESSRAKVLPRQKLSGPRFGLTFFTGETAEMRDFADLSPVMSQFGWQFETQVVSSSDGNQALMEWIVLFGGLEQDENNVSVAWLAGYRLANGIEFGVGPNLSYNLSQDIRNNSMVMAAGATLPFGDLYVPLNLAVALSDGGPRFTTLVGWIVG